MVMVLKIKLMLSILLMMFSFCLTTISAKEKEEYIVIDPGHGGMDPGCNIGDIKESDIVLDISFKIKEVLESFGYNVILTRETKEALCDGKFVKRIDTEKRINIINSYNPILVLSIHLNEFGLEQYRGAQVFYNNNNESNKKMAEIIQSTFSMYLKNTTRNIKILEHNYLLNRVYFPICIVECGFISNKEELQLLLSEEYQYKIAIAILYSVNKFI